MNWDQDRCALRAARLSNWGRVNPRRLRAVIEHAGASILDVGCSAGGYVRLLRARGYRAVGLDLLFDPLWSQDRVLPCLAGDAVALPVADRSFETVISFETLEHLQQPEAALAEFHRVARRNVILTVPDCETPEELLKGGLVFAHWRDRTHRTFFTQDSLADAIRQAGFRLQSMRRINACLIDYPVLYSLHVPPRLAYLAARALRWIPFRTQYLMTLLAVADRIPCAS
jgi:ubiquinone/menaquinone biosynthesis C-methylase UbiE